MTIELENELLEESQVGDIFWCMWSRVGWTDRKEIERIQRCKQFLDNEFQKARQSGQSVYATCPEFVESVFEEEDQLEEFVINTITFTQNVKKILPGDEEADKLVERLRRKCIKHGKLG